MNGGWKSAKEGYDCGLGVRGMKEKGICGLRWFLGFRNAAMGGLGCLACKEGFTRCLSDVSELGL